jgi:signal transduction histidine kinase
MRFYDRKRQWKLILLAGAVIIGSLTLWYTSQLAEELKNEERKKIELWADAINIINQSDLTGNEPSHYLNLITTIITGNKTIPIVIADTTGQVLTHNNIDEKNPEKALQEMIAHGHKIEINLGDNDKQYLFYRDSNLLRKLSWFPVIQLIIVAIFIAIAYMAFSGTRKAEQNQVWVGMAKETAHQLGTPTSSLLAWIDLLKMRSSDPALLSEMEKDVERLKIITDRFSKIGTKSDLSEQNLTELVHKTASYLQPRSSSQVTFHITTSQEKPLIALINPILFEWVIENLCKNAIDAMSGAGKITIALTENDNQIAIDVTDTGKGIPRGRHRTIFEPGFTTKKRGWGLGLTLVKRIVEQTHNGRIFILDSQPNKGTTFRILLKKPVNTKK